MKKILFLLFVALSFFESRSQNIGLQLHSLTREMKEDPEKTLTAVEQWGLRFLEGGSTFGMDPQNFNALLNKYNLKIVSIGAGYEELSNDPSAIVQRAKAFGASFVVCFWIPHDSTFNLQNAKAATAVFNKAGKYLREHDLKLCYHPHGYEFVPYRAATLFDFMVTQTNAEYVNFEMDVFWVKHGGGDPVALLEKYPSRFLLMHLKDRAKGTVGNTKGKGNPDFNVVLGQGDINIANVMAAAKHTNIEYFFIEDESARAIQQIPQSFSFLKTLPWKQ